MLSQLLSWAHHRYCVSYWSHVIATNKMYNLIEM
jgi:hypothetical protein